MDNELVLIRLTERALKLTGPVPTIAEIENALRGKIDLETKQKLLSYGGERLWIRGEVEQDGLKRLQTSEEMAVEMGCALIQIRS